MNDERAECVNRLLTVVDVAKILRVSVRKVWQLAAEGWLPGPVRIGKRNSRWCEKEIVDLIDGLRETRDGKCEGRLQW